MPTEYSDGDIVFGSQTLLIGGHNYVARRINVSKQVVISDVPNNLKVPTKQAFAKGKMVGTAELSLPTTTTPAPATSAQVSILPIGGGAALPFWITGVDDAYDAMGETIVLIRITQKLDGNQIASPTWYDGDTTIAQAAGPMRESYDHIHGSLEYTQLWVVHADYFGYTAWGSACPANASATLVEETKPQEFGVAGLVAWEKIWSTMPVARDEPIVVPKTYKTLIKAWDGTGALIAANVLVSTRTRAGTRQFRYSKNPFADFDVYDIPDIAVNTAASGGFQWVQPYGGFHWNSASGSPADENNYLHMVAASINRWRGDIWQLTRDFAE